MELLLKGMRKKIQAYIGQSKVTIVKTDYNKYNRKIDSELTKCLHLCANSIHLLSHGCLN